MVLLYGASLRHHHGDAEGAPSVERAAAINQIVDQFRAMITGRSRWLIAALNWLGCVTTIGSRVAATVATID
jgi:hypothetical protein